MDTSSIIRKSKLVIGLNILAGAVLLISGITMNRLGIVQINSKAIIGLSFIPLAIAFSKGVNVFFIKKYPKEMSTAIISENDERLTNERNEAEAQANRILRWLLNIIFIGYTLAVPTDIFSAAGWWIVFALFCISIILPLIMQHKINVKHTGTSD